MKITDDAALYMSNQYGNYVLQHIISLGSNDINLKISRNFLIDIERLCRQKHSSNVIEKVKSKLYQLIFSPYIIQMIIFEKTS